MKTIGKYEKRGLLGRGATSVVYKVVIPRVEKVAALKLLAPSPSLLKITGMKELEEDFAREAALTANMRHPNIVDVWALEKEVIDGQERIFCIMEFFCRNLGQMIGEKYWADSLSRIVDPEKAAGFVYGILDGLSRLHAAGIVHRDIKPFNIMLTDQGMVKITDFGLSGKTGEAGLFKDGVFVGTRPYTAPEQADDPEKSDGRSDLYSVGVILYRMLTGRLPDDKSDEKSDEKPYENPASPSALNPSLYEPKPNKGGPDEPGESWDWFILKGIAKEPEERFQSAGEMKAALERLHQRYLRTRLEQCENADITFQAGDGGEAPSTEMTELRSAPQLVTANRAAKFFGLDNLSKPIKYFRNSFTEPAPETVIDTASMLMWQRSGSDHPMTWSRGREYIDELNESAFGGFTDWRFPTVDELMTLLVPASLHRDFCLEAPFSRNQKWIWSGDSRSKRASWFVDMETGYVSSADVLDFYYVKGVRGA